MVKNLLSLPVSAERREHAVPRKLCRLPRKSTFCIVLLILPLTLSSLLQHAALSEYRPILPNRSQSHHFSMADVKLTLIPIIFIVLRIWSTVRFILLLVDSPVRQNPVLVTLHVSLKNGEEKSVRFFGFKIPWSN